MTKTLITHTGTFHADDVFSTAFLQLFIEKTEPGTIVEVKRVRSVEDEDADENAVVYDIGLGEFDHHQENSPVRENGIPYAAFGLLWREFAPSIFDNAFVEEFDSSFVSAIDAQDNGVAANPLSLTISTMNPSWDSDESPDACFASAVVFAKSVLQSHFNRYFSKKRAEGIVKESVENIKNDILVFDRFVPFESYVINNDISAKFAVFPSNREGWTLKAIRKDSTSFETRVPLPEVWLEESPTGMLFCHKALFMATFDTKENAINAANSILEEG